MPKTVVILSQYGDWKVLKDLGTRTKPSPKNPNHTEHFVLCECKCGNQREIPIGRLNFGGSHRCSVCANKNKDYLKTHAMSLSPEYQAWKGMKRRCYKANCKMYKYYGARGISVCDRWLGKEGFINFLSDMGKRPSSKHSIDRINNDGNYEPKNVRWATRTEQNYNKRARYSVTSKEAV